MKILLIMASVTVCLIACSNRDDIQVAEINGKKVYQRDFDAYLEHKRASGRNEEEKQRLLDVFLQREALASFIEQEYLADNAVVKAEIDELRREVLINRYFESYLSEQASEEAVSNYYNLNAEKYEDKKVHVAHILLRLNRNMDDSQRQVKRTTIQEAYSKLQAGMDFVEAVKLYSEDAVSAKKGGDLGWVKEGSIHKRFSEIAFSTAEGEFSEPFETSYGFHLIKVLESPKVSRKSLEAVKGQIRYELRNAAKKAERARLLESVTVEKK